MTSGKWEDVLGGKLEGQSEGESGTNKEKIEESSPD